MPIRQAGTRRGATNPTGSCRLWRKAAGSWAFRFIRTIWQVAAPAPSRPSADGQSADAPGFPPMQPWFRDNRDFAAIADGLAATGMAPPEVDAIMGGNWQTFFRNRFSPAASPTEGQAK